MALQSAGIAQTRNLPNGLPVTQFQLPNGLKLYVVENHSAPVFTYQTWFNVGAKDEKLDPRLNATGLAHLFEHMMFRGTLNHPDGEFDDILTRNGVSDENATTWLDRTNYYQSLPSEKLELAIQLESDRMVNLIINEELLDTERGAVLGEYRMGLDDADSVAYDKLYENAFSVHPYHFTTIGTEAEIQGFNKADADYFYRKYYSPNNAVILVVGDVVPAHVRDLVEKYYGAYAAQTIDRVPAPVEPAQKSERFVEFTHVQLTTSKLLLGYHTPEARHADQAALWVLQSMMTTGEGSVLNMLWVNEGLATSVGGSVNTFRDPGLFVISADLQEGKDASELVVTMDRKLGELAASPIEDEVERAKNQLLLQTYAQWMDNSSLASFMGEYISSADDPFFAFELVDAVEKVTPQDVQSMIRKYMMTSSRTVVVGKPVL